jgi:hypothetical protein
MHLTQDVEKKKKKKKKKGQMEGKGVKVKLSPIDSMGVAEPPYGH